MEYGQKRSSQWGPQASIINSLDSILLMTFGGFVPEPTINSKTILFGSERSVRLESA